MGKHRHTKDRMFISYTEHKQEWGGKKDPEKVPMNKLPFFCCSLSLSPFKNPVCSPDGSVFDIMSIIPYVKKYKKNPVTGEDLKMNELIKLNFSKNEQGEYQDPVSFKIFTDHTHLVTIKTTGNVYCFDTVDKLNREAKYWKDLVSGENFTYKDIITLQDPTNLENKTIKNFDFIRKNIEVEIAKKGNDIFIEKNEATKNILQKYNESQKKQDEEQKKKVDEEIDQIKKKRKIELEKIEKGEQVPVADFIASAIRNRDYIHERETTSDVSISVTSTASNVMREQATLEFRSLNQGEVRKLIHDQVKNKQMKGYVNILTNLGEIQCVIHANFVPRTSENFLELCEKGYYDGLKFHRLVKNFMIQGGDPTGTGKGGESIFGGKFDDEFHSKIRHDKPGILSMANSGPNTNGSQLYDFQVHQLKNQHFGLISFITLGECSWLDEQHNAFGEVIGNQLALHKINSSKVGQQEKPLHKIIIEKIVVVENPFRIIILQMQQVKRQAIKEEKRKAQQKEREHERWISNDNKFIMPTFAEEEDKPKVETAGLVKTLIDPFNSNYDEIPKEKNTRKQFNFSNW